MITHLWNVAQKKLKNKICQTVVSLKNAVLWNATPCGSCKNQRFGGTYRLHHQGDKNRRDRLLVTANVVSSSPILVTLMMAVLRSSETSGLTRATRHHIPERRHSSESPP
jgi:hypothetical protein